jgi:hypothetical protein
MFISFKLLMSKLNWEHPPSASTRQASLLIHHSTNQRDFCPLSDESLESLFHKPTSNQFYRFPLRQEIDLLRKIWKYENSSRFICEIFWDARTTSTVINLLEFCRLYVETSAASWHSELVRCGLQLIWRVYFHHCNSDKTRQWQICEVFAYIELFFHLRNYASRIVKVPCRMQWDNRITVLLTQTEKCLGGKRQWIIPL